MDYLGSYARRGVVAERIVKAALIVALSAAILAPGYYVFFRNWQEERIAVRFLRLIQARDYRAAYVLWGCTEEEPCRYYPYDEFLEDWGPEAPFGELREYDIGRSYTQVNGVIVRYTINGQNADPLWIERNPDKVNFAPN